MKVSALLLPVFLLSAGAGAGLACQFTEHVCEERSFTDVDGCNTCEFVNGEVVCTEEGCDNTLGAQGGCHPYLCVTDIKDDPDPESDDYAPGLQTDCQYIDLRTGDNLVECVETEIEEETVLVPPEGQDACIVILEVGELSEKCAELGHVLEYEFRFAGDPPEDFAVEVDCSMPSVADYCDGASCYGPGIDQLD